MKNKVSKLGIFFDPEDVGGTFLDLDHSGPSHWTEV
jgi:hypothetical protein